MRPWVTLALILIVGFMAGVPAGRASTVDVVSFAGLVEPSAGSPSDKDGHPPVSGSADPEEAILGARVVVTTPLLAPFAELIDSNADGVDDITIDGDNPRDLDSLDGAMDGILAPGTYALYWNLEKTGYKSSLPTSSPGLSVKDDVEDFRIDIVHSLGTLSSPPWRITCDGSASINQNDLDFEEAAFPPVTPPLGTVFHLIAKYSQSSAGGMSFLTAQLYYEGAVLRVDAASLYYYDTDGADPGSVATGVPAGWSRSWTDELSILPGGLPLSLSSGDYWVIDFTLTVRGPGTSFLHPYVQTRQAPTSNWKLDSGYGGFFGQGGFYGDQDCAPDSTAPILICPGDLEVVADASCCVTWDAAATATDNCDGAPVLTSDPALPATPCGAGPHVITYTATDSSGNTATCSTTVSILDATPPRITCPAPATLVADAACCAVWNVAATATDDCDPNPGITSDPALPATLCGAGPHVITYTATDNSGNTATCSTVVTLVDVTPPSLSLTTAVSCLWPPDHHLVDIGLDIQANDGCTPDADLSVVVASVLSDERTAGQRGAGGPRHCPDAVIDGRRVWLRAERSGAEDGRVYTVIVTTTDAAGNATTGSVQVHVPHDQSPRTPGQRPGSSPGAPCPAIDTGRHVDATACPLD